ncbi:MAG: DUF945 family protein [Thiolinea sp.]
MRKLLVLVLMLLVLGSGTWLGAAWLIGEKTEQLVRQSLKPEGAERSKESRYPAHTLVEYQRTLLGAKAITRMDVRGTPLDNWLDELQFTHEIEHGPLLWDGKFDFSAVRNFEYEKLLLLLSRWHSQPDLSTLDDELKSQVLQVFASQPPLIISGTVDYEQKIAYQANIPAFKTTTPEDEQVQFSGLHLSGQFRAEKDEKQIAEINIDGLEFINDEASLIFPSLHLEAQLDANESGQQITFSANEVKLYRVTEADPVIFALQGESGYRSHNDDGLQGGFQLRLNGFRGIQYPLKTVDVDLQFKGINAAGLHQVNVLQTRLQDIQAQLGWNAEDIELPEARRQQMQLELALNETVSALLDVVFTKMLQKNQSQLQYLVDIDTESGRFEQQADLVYIGSERRIILDDLVSYGWEDWLQLMRGEIKLDMAKAMLPDTLHFLLFYPLEQRALQDENEHYRMDLRLTGYDAELNGRVLAYEDLSNKFTPPMPGEAEENTPEIPAEILAMIEAQGLSNEVIQELEASDDVSADALEMLRQLKVMNEQLQ